MINEMRGYFIVCDNSGEKKRAWFVRRLKKDDSGQTS